MGEGHVATLDEVPTHAVTLTIPGLLAAGIVLCIVPEARKAEARPGCPSQPHHRRLPRVDPTHADTRSAFHRSRVCSDLSESGYVVYTIHNIQADVPAENILAMVEALQEVGVY